MACACTFAMRMIVNENALDTLCKRHDLPQLLLNDSISVDCPAPKYMTPNL